MTITRVGTTQKYAAGWDQAFGSEKKRAKSTKSKKSVKAAKASGRRTAKKATKKKAAAGKKR